MDIDAVQDIEIRILLDVLYRRFGYDFRNYANESLKRRILRCLAVCHFNYISEIIPKLLYEGYFLERLIHELSVGVTAMFRDPSVYRVIREQIIPDLRTYSFFNIWHAGCSTGEEVYSMAILLKEEGLYDRARIFATDLDGNAIQTAREGIFSLDRMPEYAQNYQQAGGKRALSDYYHAKYDLVQMDVALQKNMVFATHNLATDSVFSEMQLILCRNVMIYFGPELKNRSLNLFKDSLVREGFLCLGSQEDLHFTNTAKYFALAHPQEKIFRKLQV